MLTQPLAIARHTVSSMPRPARRIGVEPDAAAATAGVAPSENGTGSARSTPAAPGQPSSPAHPLTSAHARLSPALYRFFMVRTGSQRDVCDDLMQQLWAAAAKNAGHVPAAELEFWLRATARNLLATHWRRRASRPVHVPLADPTLSSRLAERLTSEPLASSILQQREVRDQLLLALTDMPAEDQDLLIAHYVEGVPQAALAERFIPPLSARAVEGRLYRARQALRKRLEHLDD